MSTVVLPYVPADGTTFNADQFNRDIHSNVAGESLYQTSNGRLEPTVNFSPLFLIKNEQIRPYQMSFAQSSGMLQSQDYIETAWGRSDEKREVAGTGITWFLRNQASMVMINLSMHLSWWRLRGRPAEGSQADQDSSNIRIAVYVDGGQVVERFLPISVYPSPYGYTGNVTKYEIGEAFLSKHMNLSFGVKNVAVGWHKASIRISVRNNQQVETGEIYDQEEAYYESNHRVRMRVRSGTVLAVR